MAETTADVFVVRIALFRAALGSISGQTQAIFGYAPDGELRRRRSTIANGERRGTQM